MRREDGGYDREDDDGLDSMAMAVIYLASAAGAVSFLVWLWHKVTG